MANNQDGVLEPNLYGGQYYFYLEPNPALTEALIGPQLQAITAEWTARVVANYVSRLGDRPRKGDTHPGHLASTVRAEVYIGGYKQDRWIGEIAVEAEYASADEFGRNAYAQYEGHHDLREALYQNLPHI